MTRQCVLELDSWLLHRQLSRDVGAAAPASHYPNWNPDLRIEGDTGGLELRIGVDDDALVS